jgi:hypothetical protein
MEAMRLNVGCGLVSVLSIFGTATVRIFSDRACVKWRGQLEMEEGLLLAMLDPITGAAPFDERDEFDVLYRTRQHVAKRLAASSVHSDVHAHWFVELLDLATDQRFIFTSTEWNALFSLNCVIRFISPKLVKQSSIHVISLCAEIKL